ncbi:MAG: NAD(P)-dependent oxidoreductase [Actinomycetia bacterium]|nr:NAD(P)-dependent oxidoreductase [Actinomycetes bacterium]MCH9800592.1 NAD(P)-dependent oxidoreductase [Actinomycetes bacterium]
MTRPETVVITGAGGFIARHLQDSLTAAGVEVRGIDLIPDPERGIRQGSTLAPEQWRDALIGADAVIHTAATVSNVASLTQTWTVNVLGTDRVMRAAADAGVGHFVHLSSIAAFGEDFPDGVTEDYPARMTGHPYADSKVNGEAHVLAAHAAGVIDCTIIRPGDVYGPGSRPWVVIPIELIKKKQAILPEGGRGIFSPTYVDNLVSGIELTLAQPESRGQIFTISDGVGVTCLDYFRRLADLVNGTVRTVPTPVARLLARSIGSITRGLGRDSELGDASLGMLLRRGTYSIGKAQSMLGYDPIIDLDEGIRRVDAWLDNEGLR